MRFTEKSAEKKYEKIMTMIPNFQCPSCGLIIQEEVRTFIPCSYFTLLCRTMGYIQNNLFIERFCNYILERWNQPMKFRNQRHEEIFKNEARKPRNQSACTLTALYLFSADNYLWSKTKHCFGKNKTAFFDIPLRGISISAYTLYKTALSLCLGTDDISISQLADRNTVSPMLFEIICESMTLRRYGVAALNAAESEPSKPQSNCKKDGVYQ